MNPFIIFLFVIAALISGMLLGYYLKSDPNKIGFFQEKEHSWSMMRLQSFLTFWLLTGIDYLVLNNSKYSKEVYDWYFITFFIATNLIFLIAVFYPKYLQKIIELGMAKFQNVKDAVSQVMPISGIKDETKQ